MRLEPDEASFHGEGCEVVTLLNTNPIMRRSLPAGYKLPKASA
jgi:hypothetical protein